MRRGPTAGYTPPTLSAPCKPLILRRYPSGPPFLSPPGILRSLCCVFKLGQRDRVLPFASRGWALWGSLGGHPLVPGNVLARKLGVKLVARIGAAFLPPRVAPWRYVRGGASLDVTLMGGAGWGCRGLGGWVGGTGQGAVVDAEGWCAGCERPAASLSSPCSCTHVHMYGKKHSTT